MPRPIPGESSPQALERTLASPEGGGVYLRPIADDASARPDAGGRAGSARGRIGVVHFPTHRGEPAEAILGGDGRWRCPQLPVLDRVLNILFDPARGGREGQPFGHQGFRNVAAWLKGATVEWPTPGDRR